MKRGSTWALLTTLHNPRPDTSLNESQTRKGRRGPVEARLRARHARAPRREKKRSLVFLNPSLGRFLAPDLEDREFRRLATVTWLSRTLSIVQSPKLVSTCLLAQFPNRLGHGGAVHIRSGPKRGVFFFCANLRQCLIDTRRPTSSVDSLYSR